MENDPEEIRKKDQFNRPVFDPYFDRERQQRRELAELKRELEHTLQLIELQIRSFAAESARLNIQVWDLRTPDGAWVLAPLLQQKAQILVTLANGWNGRLF